MNTKLKEVFRGKVVNKAHTINTGVDEGNLWTCICMHDGGVRTTLDLKPEHRAKLLEPAARRGEKGFSGGRRWSARVVHPGSRGERRSAPPGTASDGDLAGEGRRAAAPGDYGIARVLAMTVADAGVLIDFLAGAEPAASCVAHELIRGSLLTTAVSRFELLSGVRSARQEKSIRELLAAIPTLTLDEEAADRAAKVRRALERTGEAIGMADSLIAGTVLARGGALLTRNRRHFARVQGLRLAELDRSN